MKITKDVVLDLLPVYLSGEATPDTRALVEEFLQHDADLAQRIREQWTKGLGSTPPTSLPPDLELRTLRRAHEMIWLQILLFGLMVAFLGLMMVLKFTLGPAGLQEVHTNSFAPWFFLVVGIGCGLAFLRIRLGMRSVLRRR